MDREEIIKALKCCLADKMICDECPIQTECESNPFDATLARHALSLIEELIKENEDLKFDIDSSLILLKKHREEQKMEHQRQTRMLNEIYDGVVQLRANIARKIQEDVAIYFGTYTDRDKVTVSDVIRVISRITEEILENGDG